MRMRSSATAGPARVVLAARMMTMFFTRPPIELACMRADHHRPIVMFVNVEMRKEDIVRSVRALQVSGSGIQCELAFPLEGETGGHFKLAIRVVKPIEIISIMARFFECKKEADEGQIHPRHINQAAIKISRL